MGDLSELDIASGELHDMTRDLSEIYIKYYTDIKSVPPNSCYISVKPKSNTCHLSGTEIDFSYVILSVSQDNCMHADLSNLWPAGAFIDTSGCGSGIGGLDFRRIYNDKPEMLNDISGIYNTIQHQLQDLAAPNWQKNTGVTWVDISDAIGEQTKYGHKSIKQQEKLALTKKKNEISSMKMNSIFIELILFIITVFLLIILLLVSFKFSEISILDKILYAIFIVVGIYFLYKYIHNKYFNTI